MSRTVAETIVSSLATHGVAQIWGVVGDALNPVTDAIRTDDRIEWVGVRHEETAAFAVTAQAQLSGRLGVCMGTVGPGSLHLINGLYDAKKSHTPVLAITGQVPLEEIGTDYFQEVNNSRVFEDVAVWTHTLTSASQMPHMLEQAVNAAYEHQGVAVLTLPGDVGEMAAKDDRDANVVRPPAPSCADLAAVAEAADALSDAERVTMLVGRGARGARDEVLSLADRLKAPIVLTLQAKPGLERDNPYQVGQAGLIGNPAAAQSLDDCDTLLLVGTDFPYRESYPEGKRVIQIDARSGNIGRRTRVDLPLVGDSRATLAALLERVKPTADSSHLDDAREAYDRWRERQRALTDPKYRTSGIVARVRSRFENPDRRIRPEAVAAALDRTAPSDTIFTVDTGMSVVWLSRFVTMTGTRELLGSFNLGSMANALPQALGAQALDRSRPVAAVCGDGGLMMLLGDLSTAVNHRLPVVFVVFNNDGLGMVQLEQQHGGLPSFGTELHNPDLSAVAGAMGLASRRIEDASALDESLAWAFAHDGPVLLDLVTSPDTIPVPPGAGVSDGWGYAVAKVTEALESRR